MTEKEVELAQEGEEEKSKSQVKNNRPPTLPFFVPDPIKPV